MSINKDERDKAAARKKGALASKVVQISKDDLDVFVRETGVKKSQAEEFFARADGNLKEALGVWLYQASPGAPGSSLS